MVKVPPRKLKFVADRLLTVWLADELTLYCPAIAASSADPGTWWLPLDASVQAAAVAKSPLAPRVQLTVAGTVRSSRRSRASRTERPGEAGRRGRGAELGRRIGSHLDWVRT